ncbi:hypothetical protein LCGC14_2275360 [marine sediment metagenome]|uniref:Uncharacterized protein n=1 Tax=marine sediment metagenome TaxID=412755 RepID=A0A0F9CVY4_9ZZZZ
MPSAQSGKKAKPMPRRAAKIQLTLPLPPSANRMTTKTRRGVRRSDEYNAFRATVLRITDIVGLVPFDGKVLVVIYVYRASKRGDLDNYIKPTLDSLNNIAYHDDKQVVELHAYRLDDKHNPHIEITIEDLEGIV